MFPGHGLGMHNCFRAFGRGAACNVNRQLDSRGNRQWEPGAEQKCVTQSVPTPPAERKMKIVRTSIPGPSIMTEQRIALITGAGKQRVGAAVAAELARRGLGIAIHYRTSQSDAVALVEQLRAAGVPADAFGADLTDEAAVARLVESVYARFQRIDVLVNCASTWPRKSLEETHADDVLQAFQSNTLSTFLCCQQVGLRMTQHPQGGVIINLGDWATERPYTNYAAYFAAKGAIPTLTRCFAVELAQRNPRVRVNCILPGPVMLPPELSPAERAAAIAGTLVQREGSPQNVALAVWHFVENDFVTGACLPVDGGRTLAGNWDR